ncbi:MAG TPA: PAS domain S-box protein, partial [Bdellovibrionota bacterium]|nr:PAS domain S-box protein [Bdellovibrionota bacterium]
MIAEKGLKALAEASSDAIIVSDYDGKIRFWNKSAQTIFGYSPEGIIGKSLSILIPEQTRPAHEAGMEKLHKTGEGKVFGKTHELEGLRKNGEVFPLELSISRWQQG